MIQRLILIATLFLSHNSQAGWVSGGGELIEDAQNPWFFANTSQVKYCVLIDEANFGQDISSARKRITAAFDYWKFQFRDVITYDEKFKIATQNFVEVPCHQNPDIKFQFGVLTGEQIEKIRNPTQYVGLTVRTEYDKVNLRGKGFVYVSPQQGPLKFEFLNDESKKVDRKPWTTASGAVLLPVLIHEIGHLFGLSHDEDLYLMKEREIESIITSIGSSGFDQAKLWEYIEKNQLHYQWHIFLTGNSAANGCLFETVSPPPVQRPKPHPLEIIQSLSEKKNTSKTQSLFNQFFKIQSNERCTNYYLQNNILTVKASAPEGEIRIVGQANLEPQPFNFNTKQVVRAWLTKEQRVFASTANIQPQPIAYMERNRIYKGTFNFNDGSSPRKIFITAYPGLRNLAIGGELDGILYVDLNVGF